MTPDVCPNCGEEVPAKAKACPGCGACEATGWSEDAHAEALGIPSESFDYEEFVKREFEGEKPKQKVRWVWLVTGVVLLAIFAWAFLGPHVSK